MTIQSRITQGVTSSTWGEAAVVSVGTFTISAQATGGTIIGSWKIELGDCSGDSTYFSPRPSQISPVTVASGNGASPSWTHTTAAPSSYLVRVTTWAGAWQTGDSEVEYREFRAGYASYADAEPCVVTYSIWRDAIDAQAATGRGRHDNFGGNTRGWTGELENTGLSKLIGTLDDIKGRVDLATGLDTPTSGHHLLANGTSWVSSMFSTDLFAAYGATMQDPTGFPLPGAEGDTAYAVVDATRTFSLSPTGASFKFWVKGVEYTKSTPQSVVFPNVYGNHFVYFDATGTLVTTQDGDVARQVIRDGLGAFVATVVWNATLGQTLFILDERHGMRMPGAVHEYLHNTSNAVFGSGGQLQDISADGTGANASDAQLSVEALVFYDEDLRHRSIDTSQVLTLPAQLPILYRSGAAGELRVKAPDPFPLIYSGTAGFTGAAGRVPYNQWTGVTWQLNELGEEAFALVHYLGIGSITYPIVGFQGQATYPTVTAARAGAVTEMAAIQALLVPLFAEVVPLGTAIVQTSTGYSNTPHARFRSTPEETDYVDLRQTRTIGSAITNPVTAFPDSTFALYNAADTSRKLAVALSGVSTATTRTWTAPDVDINFGAFPITLMAAGGANNVALGGATSAANAWGQVTAAYISATAAIAPTQLSAGAAGNVILGGATAASNAWGKIGTTHVTPGTNNYVLRTSGAGAVEWGLLTTSNLSSAAAIAPTQLSAGGANSVIQGAATTGAQAWTSTPTVASLTTTAQVVAGTYLQAGSSPASIGTIRFPATHTYRVRNTAGDGDVIQFETASAAGNVNIGPSTSMGGTTNLTVLRAYGGNIVFQTEGTIRAYISTTELAPNTAGGFTLGSSSKGWGALWCETINFRTDNTYSCGAASNRSSVVYSATPAINTSDKREKTNFSAIPEDVMDVWYYDLDIATRYQWIKSVAEKGEAGARFFVGPPAQDIRDAFDAQGLDGTRYGLLCYDEWPEIVEPATETEPEKRHQEAGDRWGVRGEQALWLEAACNRREVTRLTRRIEDLEKELAKQVKKA